MGAIEEGRKLANKLWNVVAPDARAGRGAPSRRRGRTRVEERWILARLDATRGQLERAICRASSSPHAVNALYHLTFDDFCDWYAEAIKPRLYDGDADARGDGARRARAAARAAASGHAARDRGDLVAVPDADAADRRAVARARSARRGRRRCSRAVQEAAAIFRRSGVRVELEGDEQRIFEAVVRPERVQGGRQRRGRARRGSRRRSSAREGMLANERLHRQGAGRGGRRPSARSSSATGASSMPWAVMSSETDWLESLCPWPEEVRARPDARAARRARRPAARVSRRSTSSGRTASRRRRGRSGALLRRGPARRRLHLAARLRLGRADPGRRTRGGLRTAVARGRDPAAALGATQFEVADRGGARRVRRGGRRVGGRRGGARRAARRDERARRAGRGADERRARAHRGARLDARGDRRARSSPSSQPGATVVLGEPEWEAPRARNGAAQVVVATGGQRGARGRRGEAFLGRAGRAAAPTSQLPGRLERARRPPRSGTARTRREARRLHRRRGCRRAGVDRRLDARGQGRRRDAARALDGGARPRRDDRRRTRARSPAAELAARARAVISRTSRPSTIPREALARARELRRSRVLVTGSLYLLADLSRPDETVPCPRRERLQRLRLRGRRSLALRRARVHGGLHDRQTAAMSRRSPHRDARPCSARLLPLTDLVADPDGLIAVRRRLLARDRLLGVQGRAPPDRRIRGSSRSRR